MLFLEVKLKIALILFFSPLAISTNTSIGEEEREFGLMFPPDIIVTDEALRILEEIVTEERKVQKFFFKYYRTNESEEETNVDKPKHCADLYNAGFRDSGIYIIYLKQSGNEIEVYCDMESEGGGWTVIQRRGEFREFRLNFSRGWLDYANGFGNLSEEFWLGEMDTYRNKNIHELSTQDDVLLRIDMKDFDGNFRYANYDLFHVGDIKNSFQLTVGLYSGDAGDSLNYHNGMPFFTTDRDNVNNCANNFNSGWWFNNCLYSNLNGEYLSGSHNRFYSGIIWYYWLGKYYSLKWTEMKVRPQNFVSFKNV